MMEAPSGVCAEPPGEPHSASLPRSAAAVDTLCGAGGRRWAIMLRGRAVTLLSSTVAAARC